jgi:hypothetical protein
VCFKRLILLTDDEASHKVIKKLAGVTKNLSCAKLKKRRRRIKTQIARRDMDVS